MLDGNLVYQKIPEPFSVLKGSFVRYTNEPSHYSNVSGVCSSLFSSSIHPALSSASSKSNSPVFRMRVGSISLKLVSVLGTWIEFLKRASENAEVLFKHHVDFVQNNDVGKLDLVCEQVDDGSIVPFNVCEGLGPPALAGLPKSLKKLTASTTVTMVST